MQQKKLPIDQFDASEWNPTEKEKTAAYTEWLAAKIQEAIDDPRPSIPADELFDRLEAKYLAMAQTD